MSDMQGQGGAAQRDMMLQQLLQPEPPTAVPVLMLMTPRVPPACSTNSVPTMWPSDHSDPASAICWKLVLRSIISTVDKHHFGSKLPATQGVSSMAVRTLPPSAGGTAEP